MKSSNAVIVEKDTLLSKHAYYFTEKSIFKLEDYSKMLSYFLLFCVALLLVRAYQGVNPRAIAVGFVFVLFIIAFMVLWVYPKEKRIAGFSLSEVKNEKSMRQISWAEVSKVMLNGKIVSFSYKGSMQRGVLKGKAPEAAKLFSLKLGRSFRKK